MPALPQASVGFPAIPRVAHNVRITTGDLFDFGNQFGQGILTTLPPAITTNAYPVLVPKTDADDNDVAGIRLPEIAVPVATCSGWNIRSADFAADDMCNASGQKIPFPTTTAERVAKRDPRPSIQERYRSHTGYVARVTLSATNLANDRLLLREDVLRYVAKAIISPVGR